MVKKILSYLGFIILILVGLLYISKYNYILRGVSKIYLTGHVTAYISDYRVYDNHTLPASENPSPWPKHKKFNSVSLGNDFKDFLKETKTVAFVLIKTDSVFFEKYYDFY